MKFSLLVLAVLTFLGCRSMDSKEVKLTYWEAGKSREIKLNQEELQQLKQTVDELIINTNDMLRLLVNDEKINSLKSSGKGLEITYPEVTIIESEQFGKFKVDKIYLPFSGEFVGEKDDMATVFMGEGSYFSGPLRNPKGKKNLKEIILLLKLN